MHMKTELTLKSTNLVKVGDFSETPKFCRSQGNHGENTHSHSILWCCIPFAQKNDGTFARNLSFRDLTKRKDTLTSSVRTVVARFFDVVEFMK